MMRDAFRMGNGQQKTTAKEVFPPFHKNLFSGHHKYLNKNTYKGTYPTG